MFVCLLFVLFVLGFGGEGNRVRGRIEEGDKSPFYFFLQIIKIIYNLPHLIIKCIFLVITTVLSQKGSIMTLEVFLLHRTECET